MSYFWILIGLVVFFAALEFKFHVHLYHSRKERLIIPLAFFMIGVFWDSYAVMNNHWYFSSENLIGIKIGVLPLEEYMFFLVIPYCILTSYKILDKLIK